MRKIHLLCAAICVVATLLAPALADETDKKAPRYHAIVRGGRQATAILLITSNPRTFEVKPGMVQQLLNQPMMRATDIKAEIKYIHFHPLPGGREGSVIGTISIQGTGEIDEKLLKITGDRLQNILSNLARATSMDPFRRDHNLASSEVGRARKDVETLSQKAQEYRKRLLREGIVPEKLGEQIAMLDRERFSLQVELAGLRARHDAIMPHIASTGAELKLAKDKALESLKPLEEAVKLRVNDLKLARKSLRKTRFSPKEEVGYAEAERLMAQAELEQRRLAIAEEHGGGLLESLNKQAVEVEIERKSIEARLTAIEERMEQLQHDDTFGLIESYRKVTRRLEEAQRRRDVMADVLADLESQRSRMQLPRVRILSPDKLLEQKK